MTDGGLALSEPKAVGARGSAKVLAALSLGTCLVFFSGAAVAVALAAMGRGMRLSPLDLQWVVNAELLPLAALTLVAGALGDRFGQKRIILAGIALWPRRDRDWFRPDLRAAHRRPVPARTKINLQTQGESL